MPEIKVTISKLGDVKIDAEGFTGKACVDATQQLERVLSGSQGKRETKPEYFQEHAGQETVKNW